MNSEGIIILPEEITTKIAAGEIIERPANIVKELVENALDAGADEIKIEIVRGGKGLIKVSDNGRGIYPDELKKTVLRFATSKIKSLNDLTNINTYGFRGEALAAISSISNFSIKSGKLGFDTYELSVNFGKEVSYSMVTPYNGTVVSVENVFMQMPARYKFLKSNAIESKEITKLVKQFIILNDKVTFHYYSDGKKVFHYIKGFDSLKRARELLNEESLKFVEYNNESYKIKALLSDPSIQKTRADDIIIYINGRIVKDNVIFKAIMQGYSFALPHNKYPVAIFNINVPGHIIDVNVHPAKNVIKWLNPNEIFQLIYKIIRDNISGGNVDFTQKTEQFITSEGVKEKCNYKEMYNILPLFDEEFQRNNILVENEKIKISGQLFNTIIVAERDDKVYFIDQHIAHERVLFEKFINNNILEDNLSTYLNEPILYEFDQDKIEFLEHATNRFTNLGFEYERFGKNAIKLMRIPSYLLRNGVENIFEDMVNELAEITDESLKFKIIATLSCRAAIKANERLTQFEMESLVNELFNTNNPYTCPHGRKIIYELNKDDLYKKFSRI